MRHDIKYASRSKLSQHTLDPDPQTPYQASYSSLVAPGRVLLVSMVLRQLYKILGFGSFI